MCTSVMTYVCTACMHLNVALAVCRHVCVICMYLDLMHWYLRVMLQVCWLVCSSLGMDTVVVQVKVHQGFAHRGNFEGKVKAHNEDDWRIWSKCNGNWIEDGSEINLWKSIEVMVQCLGSMVNCWPKFNSWLKSQS